jgi:hypothetical protein
MKKTFFFFRKNSLAASALIIAFLLLVLPDLSLASEGSAQFFVSAWLVRVWLALVSGTVIIGGVMIALDGYASDHRLEPVLTEETGVTLTRVQQISYRKIGSGLLLVIFGCLFLVTSIFLLPDKRTGQSGIGKIVDRFSTDQVSETVISAADHNKSSSKH